MSTPTSSGDQIQKKKKLLNGVNITFTFPSGSKYVGAFRDGKMHGYGEYVYVPSGDTYKGEWRADMKHGHGIYTYASGDRYIGEWYRGKKHGKGRFAFVSGDDYTGAWKEDKMEGYGVYRLEANGNRYLGWWEDGLRCGKGVLYSGNGDVYDGEWREGKENGIGVFSQVDGQVYCGEWNNGTMDGKGIVREKGMLFLVEYMGGYLISKTPFDDVVEEVPEGWERSMAYYQKWAAKETPFPITTKPPESLDLEGENKVLKRRLEDALHALRTTVTAEVSEQTDKKSLLVHFLKNCAYSKELEQTVEDLRSKLSLIEGSLHEKQLEQLRMKDELMTKETLLHEAELKLEQIEKRRKERAAAKRLANPENPELDEDFDYYDDTEDALRQQCLDLLRLNTEYQKKIVFVSGENARLEAENKNLEEELEKLTTANEETQLQFKKFLDILSSSGAEQAVQEDGDNEETLAQKLAKINQLNTELTLRNSSLEKKLNGEINEAQDTENAQYRTNVMLKEKVSHLTEQVQELKARLKESEDNLYVSRLANEDLRKEVQSLSDQISNSAKQGCTDATLIKSIDEKMDRIARLENENAELSRLLDETRSLLEDDLNAQKEARARRRSSAAAAEKKGTELEEAKKDLARTQKKLKKTSNEKKKLAVDLYETRLLLSRVDRALQNLSGGVTVMVLLKNSPNPSKESHVTINSVDHSQLLVKVDDVDTVHQFDYCFDSTASAESWFAELRHTLFPVMLGFQVAFVTVGGFHTGKTTLMNKILPVITEYLSSQDDSSETTYSLSYRLSVLEIGVHGGYDCIGRSSFRRVFRDARGYAQAENASFVDCRINNITDVIDKYKENRIQVDGRSHLWIQIQRVKTHRTLQTSTVGRLTLVDLCGAAPLTDQVDMEAARFANRSFLDMRNVVFSLRTGEEAIPYDKSLEASLFYDVFGGNSLTTVIGAVSSDKECQPTTQDTLGVLDSFTNLRNGPYVQDYNSSDTLRWRELVKALSSDEQSEKELILVDDQRFQ